MGAKISASGFIGKKFNNLTILEDLGVENGNTKVLTRCDCGTTKKLLLSQVRAGATKSCGCLLGKNLVDSLTKHNLSYHPLYKIWMGMKERCYNEKATGYDRYGGRGIKICDEWLADFMNFYSWGISGYSKELQIERINNDRNYEPSNCKWATRSEQQRNKRNSVWLTVDGNQINQTELAKKLNIDPTIIYRHIKSGKTGDEIVAYINSGKFYRHGRLCTH